MIARWREWRIKRCRQKVLYYTNMLSLDYPGIRHERYRDKRTKYLGKIAWLKRRNQ